jgi:hypothetical protein
MAVPKTLVRLSNDMDDHRVYEFHTGGFDSVAFDRNAGPAEAPETSTSN